MDQETKERIAQEKYGKPYAELSSNEQKAVGGTYGGEKRKQEMTEAKGGDTHAAYSEMSRMSGNNRPPEEPEQQAGGGGGGATQREEGEREQEE